MTPRKNVPASSPRAWYQDLGSPLIELDSCESTNDEAARLAQCDAPSGLCVTALEQTRGRGRMGRVWHTLPGQNLAMSIVLRPKDILDTLPTLTLAAGVAVADCIAALGCQPAIKWPNDILLGDKKVCGVLAESGSSHVILGIGLNVNATDFPPEIAGQATSLKIACDKTFELAFIRQLMLAKLSNWLGIWAAHGVSGIAERSNEWLHKGLRLRHDMGNQTIVGNARAILPSGRLLFAPEHGATIEISSGNLEIAP